MNILWILWISFLMVVIIETGYCSNEVVFVPTETGNFSDQVLTGAEYVFSLSSPASESSTRHFVGKVKAISLNNENISCFYSITNSSSENRVNIDGFTGDLQIIPRDGHVHLSNVVVVYVKAQATSSNEQVNGSSAGEEVLDSAITAKVIIYLLPRFTGNENGQASGDDIKNDTKNATFHLAVKYTALLGDIIGQVQLMNENIARNLGATYWASNSWLRDPSTKEVYGEIRAFDIFPYSGDLYVKTFLAEHNQRLFNFTVSARNSRLEQLTEGQVFVWVYDESEEIQLTSGLSPSILSAHGFANLTRILSSLFGGRVALGKISDTGNSDDSNDRSIIRLIVLDRNERKILNSDYVLDHLERNHEEFREIYRSLVVRNIEGTYHPPARWDISLAGILLIAICALLLVGVLLVLCIFCRMKRRYRDGFPSEKRLIPPAIPMHMQKPMESSHMMRKDGTINGSLAQRSCVSIPVPPSLSSETAPVPSYTYGSTGNPLASFRGEGVISRPVRRLPTYEEQEMSMSLSMGSDIDSGRHTASRHHLSVSQSPHSVSSVPVPHNGYYMTPANGISSTIKHNFGPSEPEKRRSERHSTNGSVASSQQTHTYF